MPIIKQICVKIKSEGFNQNFKIKDSCLQLFIILDYSPKLVINKYYSCLIFYIYKIIPIQNTMSKKNIQSQDNIKVYVRVRPFNNYETSQLTNKPYLDFNETQIAIKTKYEDQCFAFDKIYNQKTSQEEIFQGVADSIIDNALLGINGTIFCYGQTSSGKTHTIVGQLQSNNQSEGLLPRILNTVIERKNTKLQNLNNVDIRIKISMVEIYNQKVRDLLDLSKNDLKLRQNKKQGVFIQNVTEKYIVEAKQAFQFVKIGLQNRAVGKTNLNAYSSRSHMLFIVTIYQTNFNTREAKSAKITLTDLAGSEKISKTGVQGKMLIEAKKINLSLSTLGKVIHCLSDGKAGHVPYRDSKLTRLLQQSIGGNALTALIINVSPSMLNDSQTMTSLRFGFRAKQIKNTPRVNKQYTVQELLILLEKAQLKIKAQMKVIEEYEKQNHGMRRNGGYAVMYEKPITLHMIDDGDDQQWDDCSSIGSRSLAKSTASHQEYNIAMFGDSGTFFTSTADLGNQSSQRRKPNLCKSLKHIPSMDFDFSPDTTRQNIRKSPKFVKINEQIQQINQHQQDQIIMEQIQDGKSSRKDSSKRNSEQIPGISSILNCQSKIVQFSDITNNETNQTKQSRQGDISVKTNKSSESKQSRHDNDKQNEVTPLRLQIQSEFKLQIKQLHSKVQALESQLFEANTKLVQISSKYEQSMKEVEQSRKTIKIRDVHIKQLKQKYKAKKSKINKQIEHLKLIWQAQNQI